MQERESNRQIVVIGVGGGGLNALKTMGEQPLLGVDLVAVKSNPVERVKAAIEGAEVVFVLAGLGGDTGSTDAPVFARMARERGVLTAGIVTRPFQFEGQERQHRASEAVERLRSEVDVLFVIPNDHLLVSASDDASVADAFREADDVVIRAVQGIRDRVSVSPRMDAVEFRSLLRECVPSFVE